MAKLKCSKCSRTFSMPAHLARHMSSHQGGGKRKASPRAGKKKGRRGPGRPPGRPAGRPSSSAAMGAAGPGRVINEMRAYHSELLSQRSSIDSQISTIEEALSAMGAGSASRPTGARRGRPPGRTSSARKGKVGRRGPGRPPGSGMRAGSLKDSIVKVLRGTTRALTPREIASAVKSSGYKTKAKDLTKAVSNALPTMKMISKAGRGLYKA